jgi:hydrogenase maturation protein HypF
MTPALIARRITVEGVVQGVGFRPFVFQQARHRGLTGQVANNSAGVLIHVEGPTAAIEAFTRDLTDQTPPLAHVVAVHVEAVVPGGHHDFRIIKSSAGAEKTTLISPDTTVCEDCLREQRNPGDRRYRYPFINCTNCGPRYTIIEDVPYDRPNTTMRHFKMCDDCRAEYENPTDRRFHAQPNACPVCGPQVALFDNQRHRIECNDPIDIARQQLAAGRIVAVKGLGGYHLMADAASEVAVTRLRRRKLREEKPLALMAADLDQIHHFAHVNETEARLLASAQRPIVLLQKRNDSPIATNVAPRNRYFGAMLPYTPLHYLLLAKAPFVLVATSGNPSDQPLTIDDDEAFQRLDGICDFFLIHDRPIYLRSDDSVVRHVAGDLRFIRRSRGYVPMPIFIKAAIPATLALGAELKNTVCLTKHNRVFVSQHIGDLENLQTYEFFQQTIDHLLRMFDVRPEIVAFDQHPDYLSTGHGLAMTGVEKIKVQHHHAHIVSCMAEHHLDGAVLGLAFDGTGFGNDGTIWGGEVLVCEPHRFQRVAHLAQVAMPGAAAAIREPWRMALAYTKATFKTDPVNLRLPSMAAVGQEKMHVACQMIEKRINSPLTSSLGRLFDAVAALVGLRQKASFEGQAAMELEGIVDSEEKGRYPFKWSDGDVLQARYEPIIKGVVQDTLAAVTAPVVAARFHNTLVTLFAELGRLLATRYELERVVLSGGVFQNARLLAGLSQALTQQGLSVYTHRLVPSNDGGLCLGQAVAAAAMVDKS